MKTSAWLSLSLLVSACIPRGAPVPVPMVRHVGTSDHGDASLVSLARDFYGHGLSPEEAARRADEVLRTHPHAALAHEIAAKAAELRGDTAGSDAHFLAALADLDADVPELYVSELVAHNPGELDALASVLSSLRAESSRPSVRALATHELAQVRYQQGKLDEARALVRTLAPITEWQLLGSLDNDQGKGFYAELAPEQRPLVAIPHGTKLPGPLVPLSWRRTGPQNPLGSVALGDLTWPHDFGLAWLATWVHVDAATTAQLRLSTSAPVRAYVDDVEVAAEEHVSGGAFDNVVAPIELSAGWNQVIVQSAHRRGAWLLSARLSDKDGAPLTGVTYSHQPQPYAKGSGAALPPYIESPIGGPPERQHQLTAARRLRQGRAQAALDELSPLVDKNPDNASTIHDAAIAEWSNEELGRTIDLLDRGVDRFGAHAAAFYELRARYYEQKQLWEKAQADLTTSVASIPPHRGISSAERDLVLLFERRGWQADRCALLGKLLRSSPDDHRALRERGECLEQLGYTVDAERTYARATQVAPGLVAAWDDRLHLASRQGRLRDARRFARTLERLDPTDPDWHVQEGELARRNGDPAAARLAFEMATRLAPEQPTAWKRLGELAYERGDRAAALSAWKRARELGPDDSALAQHVEYLEPLRLGYVDKLVPTQSEIDRVLSRPVKAYPNAQLAILLDHEIAEINADGSARRVITEVDEALDDKGRDAMTVQRVPTNGAVKILRAYAIGEKGERQEASSIRGGEVRFRGLQVGSKTVLQYIHYAPPPHFLPGAYTATWYFQSVGRQEEDSTWILVMDKDRPLHVQLTGDVKETRTIDGDRQVRTFRAEHQRPIAQEAYMVPPIDLATRAEVSTVASWDDYVRWERGLLTDAFRTNHALDQRVDALVEGAKTPREKLDRLFHYVAQDIRYQQDYENSIAGVRPHAAPSVVERGYGDCKDKAVLLIEMARRLGLHLSFALLRTTGMGKIAREVPDQQFNHAIAYVPVQAGIAEPFFLDPTADGLDVGSLRADDQGALSLVMEPDSGKWQFVPIPFEASDLSYDHHRVRIDVKSDTEALLTDDVSLRGMPAMRMRHALRNEGQATQVLAALASALFSGATVRSTKGGGKEDTWHPLSLSFDLDDSQALRPEEDHLRLTMPGRFALAGTIANKTRETPLHFGSMDTSVYDIETVLPAGYKVTHAPKDFTVEHACFGVSRTAKVSDGKVTMHVELVRRCSELAVADYPAYRSAVQRVVRSLDDDLLFAKVGPVLVKAVQRAIKHTR
ncbi:MAG: tetratricopeptide repeat protein [Polyangia bacterium]